MSLTTHSAGRTSRSRPQPQAVRSGLSGSELVQHSQSANVGLWLAEISFGQSPCASSGDAGQAADHRTAAIPPNLLC